MDMILTMTDVHPRDRLAYWYDVACKCFVDHECEIANPSALSVTLHNAELGEIGFSTIESSGLQSARRTPRNIAHGEDDVFFLCLQLSGGNTIRQDGREAVIRPGDFALIDAQRPYSFHNMAKATGARPQDPAPRLEGAAAGKLGSDGTHGAPCRRHRRIAVGVSFDAA